MSEELNKSIEESRVPNPAPGIPQDQFVFESIAELEMPPELAVFDESVDPEYQAMLNEHSDMVNRFAMPATSNYNNPDPGQATGLFNPYQQGQAPDLSTAEGKMRALHSLGDIKVDKVKGNDIFSDPTANIADPIAVGIRESSFDRYYAHPKFAELGWHPYADNETYYNQNSSWWDDAGRMWGEVGTLASTGFASVYRSWFSDDVMDLQSAVEFEDAMRVGNSSKGGFGGFMNNMILQSGYTFGIIGSIALEEAIMWGATALSGGLLGGAAAVKTAANVSRLSKLAKLGRRIVDSFGVGKMANASRRIVDGLKNSERARDFWQGVKNGDNILGKLLLPETMGAFKQLKTAQKAGENLTQFAKYSKAFGGFYRDIRSAHMALGEGRMEAGGVFKEHMQNEYSIQVAKNLKEGLGDVTTEQMIAINERARQAAFSTTMFNAPAIYLSNQLLLGNSFGGFKRSLSRVMRDTIEGLPKRILKTKATVQGGKIAKDVFEDVGESFMNLKYLYKSVRAGGLKGGAMMGAGAALRFFSANVSEGIQETYQEAVSAGVKDYFKELAFDPSAGGLALAKASALHGLSEQFSGQGFETFMSGFLMGGVVSGPQKAVFEGIPALYQMTFNKEAYADHKKNTDLLVKNAVDVLNKTWNAQASDVTSMFDESSLNFITQKQAASQLQIAMDENQIMDHVDIKDEARFANLVHIFNSGSQDLFREQLEDFLTLSDEELAEAFPSEKIRAKSGKLRESIKKQLANIDQMEETYRDNKDKNVNPFDATQFEPNSREWVDETLKHRAFEHARMLTLFTKNGFLRAGERAASIYEELASDPIIKDIAANDITVLLNQKTLLKEIEMLEKEIPGLGEAGTKLLKKQKEKKLLALQAIADVLYADENQTLSAKDKRFDRRKTSKLMPKVLAYLKLVAETKDDFVDEGRIKDVVNKIVDHNHLSNRQRVYDKSLAILANPERLDYIVRRGYEYLKYAHENKLEILEKAIRAFINKKEINQVLNELLKLRIYVDLDQAIAFGRTGNADDLKTFLSDEGIVNESTDPELYAKIMRIIDVYKQTSQAKVQEEKKKLQEGEEGAVQKEVADSVDEALEEAGIEGPEALVYGASASESPVLQEVLKDLYKRNRAMSIKAGIKPLTFQKFVETAVAKNHIKAYQALKKLWYQTLSNIQDKDAKDNIFNTDKGFTNWLSLQEGNLLVAKILGDTNTTFKTFIPEFERERTDVAEETVVSPGDKTKVIEVTVKDPVSGESTVFYQVVYNDGTPIQQELVDIAGLDVGLAFSDKAKAKAAQKKLDNIVPQDGVFSFDGVDLSFGTEVVDSTTGKKYIVIGTPKEVNAGGRLYLLPIGKISLMKGTKKNRNAAAIKLNPGEFKSRYKVSEVSLQELNVPSDVSKLRVDEATALIYHVNDKFDKTKAENEVLAQRRFQAIIASLNADELAALEVEVVKAQNGGTLTGQNFKYEDKAPNSRIKRATQTYSIALKIPKALQGKINGVLNKANLNLPKDNIVGYFPNTDIALLDNNGNQIDPLNINANQVKDLFSIFTDAETAAENVKKNFAIQYKMMDTISSLLGKKESGKFTLKQLGVDLSTTAGRMDFLPTGQTIGIDKLSINEVDGHTVIVENRRNSKGNVASRFITSMTGGTPQERVEFPERIKKEMAEQNSVMMDGIANAGRYVMIVKSKNGTYSYFPVKSDVVSKELLEDIADRLIKRSALSQKENIKQVEGRKAGVIANNNYNSEFNAELNDLNFFIATNIPGYTVDVNLTANGSIQLKIYDRDGKSAVSVYMDDLASIQEYENLDDKIQIFNDLFDKANTQLKEWSKSVTKSTPDARKDLLKAASKLKFDIGSIREGFSVTAPANEIASKVVATVQPNVRGDVKLISNIDGIDLQQIQSVLPLASALSSSTSNPTDIETGEHTVVKTEGGWKILTPSGKDLDGAIYTRKDLALAEAEAIDQAINQDSSSEQDPNSNDINLLSEEEFTRLKNNDFADLTKGQKEFIANKMVADDSGKSLTNKELQLLQNPAVSGQINILVAKLKASLSDTTKPEPASTKQGSAPSNQSITKELDRNQLSERLVQIENEKKAIKAEVLKRGLPLSQIEDATKKDPRWKKLNKEENEIRDKLSANKVVADNLSESDVNDINEFIEWANENLPDFIGREDIATLGNNMKSGGERVGAFVMAIKNIAGKMEVNGTIYTGTSSKYAYHEAFHAVFRMLLTPEQQQTYIVAARKEVRAKLRAQGVSLASELQRLKNSDIEKYKNLSNEQLEKLYYEEYMADEFQLFKENPKKTKTTSWIKSLFNKIMEFIKSILGTYNATELRLLYEGIDSGKFKTASVAANSFTQEVNMGITVSANKILRTEKVVLPSGKIEYKYLDGKIGRGLTSQITARVIDQQQKTTDPDFDIVAEINKTINAYRRLYSIDSPQYQTITDVSVYDNLVALNNALDNYGKDLVDAVVEELSFYDVGLETTEEEDGTLENSFGLRTTSEWDKDASMTGGFRSLSAFLRKYIGTTTLVDEKMKTDPLTGQLIVEQRPDMFGNFELDIEDAEGNMSKEKIVIPVDFSVVYSGFLKAISGISDPVQILQRLYLFSRNNPQTRAVQERLFNDLGIVWEGQLQDGILPGTLKRNDLFQAVIKGFENFRVDYLFIHRRTKDGQIISYNAALRDDANTQIEIWDSAYRNLRKKFKDNPGLIEDAVKQVQILAEALNKEKPMSELSDEDMRTLSLAISQAFKESLGLRISEGLIEFSIAANVTNKTERQKSLAIQYPNVKAIDYKHVMYMADALELNDNLMEDDEGVYGRLREIAISNANFDETVGASVFKNPAGDLVYAHQLPTFHLKQIAKLNDVSGAGGVLDKIYKDLDLNYNYLLGSPAFRALSAEGRLKIQRIAGVKSSKNIRQDDSGGIVEGYDKSEQGITYGDLTQKEFLMALLGSYTANMNNSTGEIETVFDGKNNVALTPSLIRVIEASNTGDMVSLPVIRSIMDGEDGGMELTPEVVRYFIDRIEAETERILDESGLDSKYNPETQEGTLIAGYNATKNGQAYDKNGRAFKYSNTGNILDPIQIKAYEEAGVGQFLIETVGTDRLRSESQSMFLGSQKMHEKSQHTIPQTTKDMVLYGAEKKESKKGRKTYKYLAKAAADQGTLHKVKYVGFVEITNSNESEILNKLGDAISNDQTETHTVKWIQPKDGTRSDQERTKWVENEDMKLFLQGKRKKHLYEIVKDDITELSQEELKEAENAAVEREDYENAGRIVREGRQRGGLKKRMEDAIAKLSREEASNTSFDDILESIGETRESLRSFVTRRLMDEFAAFQNDLEALFGDNELPKFIMDGVVRPEDATRDAGKFATTADKLNLRAKNKTWNLAQIFFSNWVNTSSLNEILLGDQAQSLKDAVDAVKRAKMQNAAYYSAASSIAAPEFGINKPVQEMSIFPMTEPTGKSRFGETEEAKKDIDHADAQLWMTVKAFKHMWFGFGKLTAAQNKLLERIANGEKIPTKEIFGKLGAAKTQAMLNSKKLVYGDGKTFIKMSAFTLTKQYTSYQDAQGNWIARPDRVKLHNMRERMERFEEENDTIALAAPISAMKMLKENVNNINTFVDTENVNTPLSKSESMTLDANFMGLQVINPSNKLEITDPTQIKTLITGEQNDATKVSIPDGEGGWVEKTIGDLRYTYNKSIADRLTGKYLDKRNLVFSFDVEYAMNEVHKSIDQKKITADLLAYLQYAQTSLMASQSASELLEFFGFDPDTGEPKYELNNPLTIEKFEQLFLSYFNKSVISEKLPGISAALVSDYGVNVYRRVLSVDENGYPDRQEIIRSDDFLNNYSADDLVKRNGEAVDFSDDQSFETLKTEVDKSKGKGVIILDRLRFDMKQYDEKGNYTGVKYSESMLPAHTSDVYTNLDLKPGEAIPDSVAKMFGIRIPSQDNHSTINIKVVDFLPVYYGSSIISPRELVEVSGADFDIDKLYIQMKEYYSERVPTGKKEKIYDVVVDMYEHTEIKDQTKAKEPLDVWVVDSLEQAQKQLDLIKEDGGGVNFGEIEKSLMKTENGDVYYFIPHKRGDNKRIYIKGTEPKSLLVKDKLRTKGKPYMKEQMKIQFKEFGNNFNDYQRYVKKSINDKGSVYKEAANKAKIQGVKNSLTDAEIEKLLDSGWTRQTIDALLTLGLPLTEKQYKSYVIQNKGRQPYSGAVNNEILDLKWAMMSNEHNTTYKDGMPISYEPADIDVLTDLWDEVIEELPELADAVNEDGLDPDNLLGQGRGFGNNKEGAASIGAVVRPNLFLSLLQEYNVKLKSRSIKGEEQGLRLTFGGQVYNEFSGTNNREVLEDGSAGRRKQYIISALITAMTDNAKERLAAKLGLAKNALGVVAVMTAMGVPIKTSIYLVNNPTIKRSYFLEKTNPEFIGTKKFIETQMRLLYGVIKDLGGERGTSLVGTTDVNQETLKELIKDPILKFNDATDLIRERASAAEEGNEAITLEEAVMQYDALAQFLNALEISGFTKEMGALMDLTSGYGQNIASMDETAISIEKLGLNIPDAEWKNLRFEELPLMDVRPLFRSNTWQSTSLSIFEEFYNELLPEIFLSRSKGGYSKFMPTLLYNSSFYDVKNQVMRYIDPDVKRGITRDILSIVTIKSYMHHLSLTDPQAGATLTNDIIYPSDNKNINIVAIVEKARELQNGKFNFFLDDFIRLEDALAEGNKTGTYIAGSNTLTRIKDSDKVDLQNGFKELFLDPKTRYLAMDIMNYLMVKDGLQPAYKTLLSAISPPALGKYLENASTIKEAFKRGDGAFFESVMGTTYEDFFEELVTNYFLSAKTSYMLSTHNGIPLYNPKANTIIANKSFTQTQVASRPNDMFIIFDNEAGVGSSDSKIVRDQPNAFRLIIKKGDANIETNYYSPFEVDQAKKALREQVKAIASQRGMFNSVFLPSSIPAEVIKGLQDNSPELYDELVTLMDEYFDYNIAGYKTKEEVKEDTLNTNALKAPINISMEGNKGVLTIDLLKGVYGRSTTFEGSMKTSSVKTLKGKPREAFDKNIGLVSSKGFGTTKVETNGYVQNEVIFPAAIRTKVGDNWKYFKLKRVIGSKKRQNMHDMYTGPLVSGSYAQYVEVDVKGSTAQFAGGYIFGDLKSNKEVRKIIRDANPIEESDMSKQNKRAAAEARAAVSSLYVPGENPKLDAELKAKYDEINQTLGFRKGPKGTFEFFLTTPGAIMIMDKYDSIKSKKNAEDLKDNPQTEIGFDGNNVTLNGQKQTDIKNVDLPADGEVEGEFVLPGSEDTDPQSSSMELPEDGEIEGELDLNASIQKDESKFKVSMDEQVAEFWESLSIPQKRTLRTFDISSLADLQKEAKRANAYTSFEQFKEEINKCFNG